MLNMITTAKAEAAKPDAATAVLRPLAGSGAGAFMREGTLVASRAGRTAASAARPRVRCAGGAGTQGDLQTGSVRSANPTGFSQASQISAIAAKVGSGLSDATQHFNQTTRIPVIPGGVGPHPAREPDPV